VERLIESAVAELLIGVRRDPAWGLALTIGFGGVAAELLGDAETVALPADRAEIAGALGRLRLFPLLDGHRGRPRAAIEAALDAAEALARFAAAHATTLEEVEINPLIVTAGSAVAADALLRIVEPEPAAPGDVA
jgi:hypothetical protein